MDPPGPFKEQVALYLNSFFIFVAFLWLHVDNQLNLRRPMLSFYMIRASSGTANLLFSLKSDLILYKEYRDKTVGVHYEKNEIFAA